MRPAAKTATNQFDCRDGDGVKSRLGFLDLSWGLWMNLRGLKLEFVGHQPLYGCLIGGRERPVFKLLLLVTGPQRIRVGYQVRLADWPLARMLLVTLTKFLIGPLAGGLVELLAGPRARPPLT